MSLNFTYIDNSGLLDGYKERLKTNLPHLKRAIEGEKRYSESLGWHTVNEWAGEEWIEKYLSLRDEIKGCDALVVIGIGGSNQGARAVYEAIGKKSKTELIWCGNTLSSDSMDRVLKALENKTNVYVDCIAKNFETLEPGVGFRVMREFLRSRYKDEYSRHVIVTFTEDTPSWKMAEKEGYYLLPFPSNIGGRFTSLSPVCLFPLAVAGLDIRALCNGARKMEECLKKDDSVNNIALRYATARTILKDKGKSVELLSYFEPRFYRFSKWWKQLFGESEGKDNKGLLPMSAEYSEDLHSLGQFIQDGSPILFETFLNVINQDSSVILKGDISDGFFYLDGKNLWDINKAAFSATLSAHSKRFPCLVFDIDKIDEEAFGELFYFFEFACYISCNITGVNPFDQNGVEDYKRDMFHILGK